MSKLASSLSYTATLAALLGSLAVTACSTDYYGQNNTAPQAAPGTAAQQTWSQEDMRDQNMHNGEHHAWHGMKDVEARIQKLHDKLMITSDQEGAWAVVADTMRNNEANLDRLIQARHTRNDNRTAVDDLQSYQAIAEAHADGMQKMVNAFAPLYDMMSDAQKKNADEVFGKFEGHRGMHHSHRK